MAAFRRREPEDEAPDPAEEAEFGDTLILKRETEGLRAEARRAFDGHDFEACVRILGAVHEPFRSPEGRELIERATAAIEEIARLEAVVKQRLADRSYEGLALEIERYLELRPGDAKYAKLLRQLRERGADPKEAARGQAAEPRRKPTFRAYAGELLRYLQVGAFVGGVLGAAVGGFWRPEGYVAGGILGGLLAAANEWLGDR